MPLAAAAKKYIWNLLKISLAAGLIFYLVRQQHIDVEALWKSLTGPQIFLYGFIGLILHAIVTYRLQLVLKLANISCDYRHLLKFNFIGVFFNYSLPGSVSGDIIKGVFMARHCEITKARALSAAFIDRLFALYSVLIGSVLALLMGSSWQDSYTLDFIAGIMVLALAVATLVIFILSRASRAPRFLAWAESSRFLRGLRENVLVMLRAPKLFASVVLVSLVGQSLYVFLFMLICDHLAGGTFASYLVHFFVQSVGLILVAVPISPAGIGVGQAVFHFLYNEVGVNAVGVSGAAANAVGGGAVGATAVASAVGTTAVAATAITIVQILNFLVGLVGAYYFVTYKKAASDKSAAGAVSLASDSVNGRNV